MSDVLIDQDTMEDIGDSIRSKLGVQTTYLPSEMPNAIMSISGGGGGGSAKYSETVLWEGNARPNSSTTYTLSDSIENYNVLVILGVGYTNGTAATMLMPMFIPVSTIVYGSDTTEGYTTNASVGNIIRRPTMCFTDATHFKVIYVDSSENTSTGYIKVVGIKWETMQTALIYSEEEREVGVWTDGKPLYQKIVSFTVTNGNGYTTYEHNIANVIPIAVEGEVYRLTGETIYTEGANAAANLSFAFGTTYVYFYQNSTYFNNHTARARLYYTKTTDTPGSGIWTTTGEYAHHYSTTEHVVGTWVDGSTLYEKTIVINNPASGGDWVEYDIGVPNLNKVIKQEGTWDRDVGSSGIWTYDLNAVNELSWNNNYIVNARIRNGTKKLAVYVGSQYSCPQLRFTFQYTKTT